MEPLGCKTREGGGSHGQNIIGRLTGGPRRRARRRPHAENCRGQPDGGAPAGAPKGVESAPKADETAEMSPEPLAEEGFLYDLDYELDSSGNATITGFAGESASPI